MGSHCSMSFLSSRSSKEQTTPQLVQSTFLQREEATHTLKHKSSAQLIIREPSESRRKQTLINMVPRGKIRGRLSFSDNGSCKARRGGAAQGEDAKIHYQPTLSGNPLHGLGKAPHWLFVKGCSSPAEYSLLKEQVWAKRQKGPSLEATGQRSLGTLHLGWGKPHCQYRLGHGQR